MGKGGWGGAEENQEASGGVKGRGSMCVNDLFWVV